MDNVYLYVGIVAALLVVIFVIILLSKSKSKRNKKVKTISIDFVNRLRLAIGSDNLIDIKVEHERVKFYIKDYKKVDMTEMKALSYKGVFVKSNEITATFEYEPKEIINSLKQ
ncbi:hypothetical protein BN85308320 [Paracholeplasma brassicae]|uniref:PTS EIIB type-1 domain-containing protein n=1 Tax=Acholeplasma brassicae TaxID=61635 RepID=U4KRL7_9MOLU|nr:hypothetical protein [Paracholeplasma brassicae]CCV65853.1 hypothetical protein BN85308320 [Paracholeplasma brassicae]